MSTVWVAWSAKRSELIARLSATAIVKPVAEARLILEAADAFAKVLAAVVALE